MADIVGTAGNDRLQGTDNADTLRGGAGDDRLDGLNGDDRYIIASGSGNDTINRFGSGESGGNDRLVVEDVSISSDNVRLSVVSGDDLLVSFDDSSNRSVRINNHFSVDGGVVELIEFADGSTQSLAPASGLTFGPFPGNDAIAGTVFSDTLIGGPGDDRLDGGNGDDRYVIGVGSGNDTINRFGNGESGGLDRIVITDPTIAQDNIRLAASTGQDLVVSFDDSSNRSIRIGDHFEVDGGLVELIEFADGTTMSLAPETGLTFGPFPGNDTILGTVFDDVLIGGPGDDRLDGGNGNDRYIVDVGSGNDRINRFGRGETGGDDRIEVVDATVSASDLAFFRSGNDLILSFNDGSNRSVRIDSQFTTDGGLVENVLLADGTSVSLNPRDGLVLGGFPTNDRVDGSDFSDVIVGGPGNDVLRGGLADDLYLFEPGFGQDRIDGENQGNNILAFLDRSSSTLTQNFIGSTLRLGFVGSSDQVDIRDFDANVFSIVFPNDGGFTPLETTASNVQIGGSGNNRYVIDDVGDRVFERAGEGFDRIDVTVNVPDFRTPEHVEQVILRTGAITATPAFTGTRLAGVDDDNFFYSGPGNDTYDGNGGNDTLSYERAVSGVEASLLKPTAFDTGGAGADKIDDIEILIGSDYDDVLVGAQGLSNMIDGRDGNDLIVGFAGADRLIGGGGSDTFSYNALRFRDSLIVDNQPEFAVGRAGDGEDTIVDFEIDSDRLDLSRLGVSASDVNLTVGRVEVDATGDGAADFAINFENNALLRIDDIILS